MSNREKFIEAADLYQEKGYYITPVNAKKIPVIKDWQNQGQLSDEHIKQIWGNAKNNLGIVTGEKSDLLILDVDVKNNAGGFDSLKEIESSFGKIRTYTVRTPSGGIHLYFKYPKGLKIGNRAGFKKGLDIRANGGQVVAPPSKTPEGKYVVLRDAPIIETPEWLIKILTDKNKKPQRFELPEVIGEGSRNDTLHRYASSLQAKGYADEEIYRLVSKANNVRVQSPLPERELMSLVDSALLRPKSYLHTDLGNSERFVDEWQCEIIYCSEAKSWYIWNGQIWEEDKADKTLEFAKKTARNILKEVEEAGNKSLIKSAKTIQSKARLKSMRDLAQSKLPISIDKFDQHDWQLNLENGILNLETGELLPHDKTAHHSLIAPVSYNSEATCPLFEGFLKEIFQKDLSLIPFFQTIMGYCLTGDTSEQSVFLLLGDGRNGKSTLVNILTDILGPYHKRADVKSFLNTSYKSGIPSDIARLKGARLVTASEAAENAEWNEALLKDISGGDIITARKLYQNEFEFVSKFKLVVAANIMPRINGVDVGIWRRIKIIPFDHIIDQEAVDKDLPEKLKSEKSGIFNFALQGLANYRQSGLIIPKSIKERVDSFKKQMDVVQGFIDDCCITGPIEIASARDLYEAYKCWSINNEGTPVSQTKFGRQLKQKGFKSAKIRHEGRVQTMYHGIKINDEVSAAFQGDLPM